MRQQILKHFADFDRDMMRGSCIARVREPSEGEEKS
jgi:hypothetical protein